MPHFPSAKAIFLEAVERSDPTERERFLSEACGTNAELRRHVEALLRVHDEPDSLLDQERIQAQVIVDRGEVTSPTIDQPAAHPGTQIGPYKLIEHIGDGGMGTVWMAQQTEPVRRLVAVKLIKAGMDSRQVIARFEAERQALALMDHANIARVLDAGTTDAGRPYFVMDLVRGVPITRYCDEHHLTPRQRLELFIPVCQAIQHAHQKGIIHRDLKPSNVLVALYDGKPVPKVIDFGVAKAAGQTLTDKTLVTGFGNIVGTLEYMSPEQAEINQLDIDTRSDIYSLGVLLYELLTGSTPFTKKDLEKAGMLEMLRVIREQEPTKPSTKLSTAEGLPTLAANRGTEPAKLTKLVRGELDWIVMKALEKDRNRRYETSNGFAMDVQRYLADEPVLACPPSAAYRIGKFARRNKLALATVGIVLFFLVLLGSGASWMLRDRWTRLAATASQVEQALADSQALYREGKLPEAQLTAQKAQGLLESGGGSAPLKKRVQQWLADLHFVAELDEIHDRDPLDFEGAHADYVAAFRRYGIDVETLPSAEVAARIAARPIQPDLVAVLDRWAGIPDHRWADNRDQGQWERQWERLVEIAKAADPDPWRNALREATVRRDRDALRKMAASADLGQLPATSQLALGSALWRIAGEQEAAVSVLRRAQRQHPDDFRINFFLGWLLTRAEPAEATSYLRAAAAIRPGSAGAHSFLGSALVNTGNLDGAIAEMREAIRLRPGHYVPRVNLCAALEQKGSWDEAIAEQRELGRLERFHPGWLISVGRIYRRKGSWDEAIAHYRKYIELRPDDSWGHLEFAKFYLDKGELDEAIAEYRKAIPLRPYADDRLVQTHRQFFQIIAAKQSWDETIAEFRKVIELAPDHFWAHWHLANAYRIQGQLDEAVAAYRKMIQLQPQMVEPHVELGLMFAAEQSWDEAIAEFRKCTELAPEHYMARWQLANTYRNQGQLDEAVAAYRKMIELNSKVPYAHLELGLTFAAKQSWDEAIVEFRKCIELAPGHFWAHCNLANAYRNQGQFDEAVAAYQRTIELDPQVAQAHFELGLTFEAKRSWDEAIAEFRTSIVLATDHFGAHWHLASAHRKKGQLDDAVAAFRKTIQLQPAMVEPHVDLGLTFAAKQSWDEALAEFRKAIELAPDHFWAHCQLGNAYRNQGQLDEAIAAYQNAIHLNPNHAQAHLELGLTFVAKQSWDDAIAEFRQTIELRPNHGWGHCNLANAYHHTGQLDEAVAAYRTTIELEPKYAAAHYGLGNALGQQGKFDEAIACFEKSIELDPNMADAHNSCAWLLATTPDSNLRDADRAVTLAKKAVELEHKNASYWNTLGVALYRAGHWKEALAALDHSMNLSGGGSPCDWLFVAMSHWQLDDKDEARKSYDKAIEWMEANAKGNEQLIRFRAEAEELLKKE
jgi:tetratricopeptide (TPR) repeat protein